MIDIAAAAEAFRVLAQAGIRAATAAESFREAAMALPNLDRLAPMSAAEKHLHQWLQGRHIMVVQRADFEHGFEVICRICAERVLFIPQDALRLRAMRITLEQIDVMAGEHYCRLEEKVLKANEPDPIRMIRFRRKDE